MPKRRESAVLHAIKENLSPSVRTININSCEIKFSTDYTRINKFYENHHFDAISDHGMTVVIEYNDEIEAAMTFVMNEECELKYYASKGNVINASKELLNYFTNIMKVDKMFGYADHCYSSGKFYERLGFTASESLEEECFYVGGRETIRIPHNELTEQYNQDDLDITFEEYVEECGLVCVWDCGKTKWILSNNPLRRVFLE